MDYSSWRPMIINHTEESYFHTDYTRICHKIYYFLQSPWLELINRPPKLHLSQNYSWLYTSWLPGNMGSHNFDVAQTYPYVWAIDIAIHATDTCLHFEEFLTYKIINTKACRGKFFKKMRAKKWSARLRCIAAGEASWRP